MKKIVILCMLLSASFMMVACDDSSEGVKKIGIIQYTQHPALDQSREGFMKALADEGFKEGDNIEVDYQNAQGDASTTETIANTLVNDQNDLIYAIATPSAQAAAQKTKDIPIVVAAVTDPEYSGLVKSNKKPGGNITGVSDLTPVKEQIVLLKELLPGAKKVAIMYANSEDNSKFQAELAKKALEEAGLEWQETTVSDLSQIQQVAESLVGEVDAVYMPTDNLMAEGISTVTMVTNAKGIPCIVGEKGMTEGGGLASDAIDYYNLGYKAGKQAAKILKGEAKPADMPIEYLAAKDRELVVNKKVADQLGIKISKELAEKATILE